MHVGMLGHCAPIVDITTKLLPSTDGAEVMVYGASRCKEWAWLNVPNGDDPSSYNTKASINQEVTLNADNYAWYATSEYFGYKWGRNAAKKRQLDNNDALYDYPDLAIDPESGKDINGGATYDDETDNGDADVVVGEGEHPDLDWPQNCKTDDEGEVTCDFVRTIFHTPVFPTHIHPH